MANTRHKNGNWALPTTEKGAPESWDVVKIALLMDIRDELQANNRELRLLNQLLHCQNFVNIPRKLDAIHRKLPTRRKRKAKP